MHRAGSDTRCRSPRHEDEIDAQHPQQKYATSPWAGHAPLEPAICFTQRFDPRPIQPPRSGDCRPLEPANGRNCGERSHKSHLPTRGIYSAAGRGNALTCGPRRFAGRRPAQGVTRSSLSAERARPHIGTAHVVRTRREASAVARWRSERLGNGGGRHRRVDMNSGDVVPLLLRGTALGQTRPVPTRIRVTDA